MKEHMLSFYRWAWQTTHRKNSKTTLTAVPHPRPPGNLTNGRGVISGSEDQLWGPVVARADVGDVGLPPDQLLCAVGRDGWE